MRTIVKLIFPVLLALLGHAALPAYAQSGGGITGVVLNSDDRTVAGAQVEVAGNGLSLHRRTGKTGRFAFTALPIGTYRLSASAQAGNAYAVVDLSSEGADVTLHLLKTVASTGSISATVTRGSGTDVVLNQNAIAHSPAYASLPNLLLQLPGAARGANGVVHINGDHGDINYVVDGVSIPQALNREVGSEIDPADISFMDVLEGAYPAQYGGRFAAVINIDTKAAIGPAAMSGYVSGGSFGTFDSDLDYHTPLGKGSLALTARQERSMRALDPPNFVAVHDNGSDTNQFLRYALPLGNDFILASIAHSYQTFQIPNDVSGGQPASTDDNETQDDAFAYIRYYHALHANGAMNYGVAFKRSRIRDLNDPQNDFIYGEAQNIAAYTLSSDRTARDLILTADAALDSTRHAVRYGVSYDVTNVQKRYEITLQPDNFISNAVATVTDDAPNVAHTESAYVQDAWQMGLLWRLDFGLRFDAFRVFSTQFARGFTQTSPRLKITRVYGPRAAVYLYAGRFFTPFSFENVSPAAAQQLNAPLQPSIAQFDLKPQRDTDVELGASVPFGPGQLGLRVMQKIAVDLIDDTQVGLTALHQDINYARGNISSQSAYYQQPLAGGGRAYLSLTHTRSINRGCETQLLAPCFGAPSDWTPADHDQRWDVSGGIVLNDRRGGWFAVDGEYGSGLSSAYCAPADDNCKVPPHTTFDLQKGIALSPQTALTLGIGNVFNDRYRITYLNAQGNHYAAGRTFSIGLRLSP